MEEFDIVEGLKSVIQRINAVCLKQGLNKTPKLVAVSKTKPKEMIISLYNCGQRHFGENYIQELFDKSTDPEILEKCREIKWHFIGPLQNNKIKKVITSPGLYVIETLHSEKHAISLNNALKKENKSLKVMVQVNTSREEGKNGYDPETCHILVRYIIEMCPQLEFIGLMTIGKFGYDLSDGPNPDFLCLKKCREDICDKLNLQKEDVELSMGMSNDYEHAIELGSTNVRVGTSIFGHRTKKIDEVKAVTEGISDISVK